MPASRSRLSYFSSYNKVYLAIIKQVSLKEIALIFDHYYPPPLGQRLLNFLKNSTNIVPADEVLISPITRLQVLNFPLLIRKSQQQHTFTILNLHLCPTILTNLIKESNFFYVFGLNLHSVISCM